MTPCRRPGSDWLARAPLAWTNFPAGRPTRIRGDGPAGPEHQALLADSIGMALLLVLDTLSPTERLAFVLHDVFAVPFDQLGPIPEHSPAAANTPGSPARRRVRDA